MRRLERDLWTAQQVARRFNASVATVRKWTYQRRLASVRIGRLCRYRPEDVERFAAAGERPALRGEDLETARGEAEA
jgi:excisionase family DNA binding protein